MQTGGALSSASQPLEVEGRRAAGAVADRVKQKVAVTVEQQKEQATGSLQQIAQALRDVGRSLEQGGMSGAPRVTGRAAEQVDRTADYLRRRDFDGLVADTRRLARNHPEIFVGGAVLVGILLGRFLRSSTPEPAMELGLTDSELEGDLAGGSPSERSSSYPPPGGWA
jgi:hypothetical protein